MFEITSIEKKYIGFKTAFEDICAISSLSTAVTVDAFIKRERSVQRALLPAVLLFTAVMDKKPRSSVWRLLGSTVYLLYDQMQIFGG